MTKVIPMTRDAIARACGELPDWKIVAIERSGGHFEDLEVALAYAAAESDVMGEERRPLNGPALEIYRVLMADSPEWEDD